MKTLVLFTVSYPYGSKEQFLETEITYLSEAFKEVIVIPMQTDRKMREVPPNVKVDAAFSEKNSNAKFLIYSFLSIYLYKEIFKYPFVLLSLTRLSRLFAFVGKGVCLYKYLKNAYGSENIFYSYWFNGAVFGCYLYDKHVHPIKFFTRVHGSDLYLEVNKDYLPLRPSVLKKITKVFSISENGKKYLEDHYAFDAKKVTCSRLGSKDNKIYTRMTESPKEFSIVSCSHISPVKRIDMLLKALCLVAKDNTDINILWTHIGTGDQYSDLKELSSQMSVKNLEVRLLGSLSNKDVLQYYKTHNIDLFVNVSRSEGIPVTFMEAFSCSIPVLAIDNGGISEIVNDDNGVLLDSHSSLEDVSKGISACVKHKDALRVKKSMARSMWERSYNADINYISFCKELNKDD